MFLALSLLKLHFNKKFYSFLHKLWVNMKIVSGLVACIADTTCLSNIYN